MRAGVELPDAELDFVDASIKDSPLGLTYQSLPQALSSKFLRHRDDLDDAKATRPCRWPLRWWLNADVDEPGDGLTLLGN